MTSKHHPKVTLLLNDREVASLTFDVQLTLNITATTLLVRAGRIWQARGSEFQGEAALSYRGFSLMKKKTASFTLPGAIDRVDVGVTGIDFAIAQSGTLVETASNDAVRLVSGLPRTYIGVLRAEDIVDKFHDGAARIRRIVQQHDQNLVISFISGPSRTGDIELKLTLGVHGPEEAHAVIIGA